MKELLAKVNNQNTPLVVPILPEKYSVINNCFYNVIQKVSLDKGKIIYGWKIRQGQLIDEAERHAIWKSPNEELIDITPSSSEKITTFLEEDKDWKYDGKFTDNIRINVTNNSLVDDYILLCETITELWKTSLRKSQNVVIILEPIKKLIEILEIDKIKLELFVLKDQDYKCSCFCGSLLKYNECHIFNIQTKNNILNWVKNFHIEQL